MRFYLTQLYKNQSLNFYKQARVQQAPKYFFKAIVDELHRITRSGNLIKECVVKN